MREGDTVEFSPEIFEGGTWITCIIEDEKINAKIKKRLSGRKYIIKIPLFNERVDGRIIKIQNGTKNGLYEFQGQLYQKNQQEKYCLKINQQGRKIQERRYKRINIYHNTVFTIIDKPLFVGNQYSANIEDISAGGAKLITAFKLVPGNTIELELDFDDFPFESLTAEVVRSSQLARINSRIYDIGVKFLCSEADRKQIAGYVNKKQIEYKEQGLL